MKYSHLVFVGAISMAALDVPIRADEKPDQEKDEALIRRMGKVWQDGWNNRDVDALAALLAEDVDFITVRGSEGWLQGRDEFRADHDGKLKTRFANSEWTTKSVHVKFIRPDLAFARVLWSTTGDKVRHVKHGEPRAGIFTWVVEKRDSAWRIIASQNTETMPVLPGQ